MVHATAMSEGPEREQPREPVADPSAPAAPPESGPEEGPQARPEAAPAPTDRDGKGDGDADTDSDTDVSNDEPDDEADDEEPEAAPANAAAPPPETEEAAPDSTPPLEQDAVWGAASRSVAIGTCLGFALAAWAQLALAGREANDLLAKNAYDLAERVGMIKGSIAGAGLGAGVAGYFVWAALRAKRSVGLVERWLWLLSPLMLAPGLASVLHYKPWVNAYDRLLPLVLLLGLAFEVLAFQALRHAPRPARDWWREAIGQLPRLVRERAPLILVVAGSLFYIGFFCFYLVRWHYKIKTGNFDLSINNNLLFGGLHGKFLESTVVFPQDPPKYLANHAKFGGYLFLPIYALFPRPETLLVIQSTLIGASAMPLFGFARKRLPEWLAAIVALAYLAYYPMHGASFSEFQYVPMAGFFVLTTVWAAETRRWIVFGIIFVVGITMREDIPIGMALVGGFLLLSGHRPLPGLILAVVSVVYFVTLRFFVMDSAGDWWFPNMYKELWADGEKGFRSVIKTLISNPLFVISKILVEKKLIYLMHLFVPLLFLPVRRWYLWAAFIPGVILTLLVTNYDPPITFTFHYVMHWTPYLFLAAVLSLEAIGKRPDFGMERRWAAALAMAAASLVLSYNYGAFARRDGSFKGGFQRVDFEMTDAERERLANLRSLIAMIPPDASVAATEKIGPHASSRVLMYTMRHGPQGAEYILASSRELKLSKTKPRLLDALRSEDYGVVKRIADLALLKRGHDTSQNEQMISEWRLIDGKAKEPAPPPEEKPPEEKPAEPAPPRAREPREPRREAPAREGGEPEPRGPEDEAGEARPPE